MQLLLGNIFISLQDDTLSFLAGVWLDEEPFAVTHASACLDAYEQSQAPVDFQTILPALLTVFAKEDNAHTKRSAARCLKIVRKISQGQKFERVYAFDSIYGFGSSMKCFTCTLYVLGLTYQ
jgi:hypothetical protein